MRTGRLRDIALIIGGGLALGLVAFAATAMTPRAYLGGPDCTAIEDASFDPWSGLGRGRLLECMDTSTGRSGPIFLRRESPPRAAFGFRHAIPLPIGVPAGCIAVAIALGIWEYRRRPAQP